MMHEQRINNAKLLLPNVEIINFIHQLKFLLPV